ncbi:MAG: hypothetical protein KBB94_01965 [Legionellaceae bacterium]|nr:hypothetical protein [Legionellaceae bacterium]MBP9774857.1 hypothetical protein [Legionellaceae bacterium]
MKLTFVSVGVAILIASLFAIPHVLLFFNALPWALSATFLSITSTLIVFEERLARNRNLENRHDFSLIKIILSPTSSIARLRVLLEPNIHRARNQLELRRDVAAAENSLQVRTPGIEALTTRYMNVFARFPKEAIIDDAALYKKQFDRLREGQTFNEENEEQKRRLVDLRKDACRYALQEAQGLSAAYQETLSSAEQRRCYQNYREVALSLSLYASCPVSLEDIHSGRPEDFQIVEKRYTAPVYIKKDDGTFEAAKPGRTAVYAVPGRTVVYQTDTFMTVLENRDVALDPLDRDPFFNSSTYPNTQKIGSQDYRASDGASYPTHYVYYAYSQTHGHGLSLQLCEAMEAFLDPTLEECKQAALQKTQAMPAPAPRKNPLTRAHSTLVSQSMFRSIRHPTTSSSFVGNDAAQAALAAGIPVEEIALNMFGYN